MSGRKLLFLATEDWFVRSHFLPLLKRAVADGYETLVAARSSGVLSEMPGVRVIDMPFVRGSLKPWEVGAHLAELNALIAREKPDIIHAIATKPIALLLLAQPRNIGLVFAVTGRGYLAIGGSLAMRFTSFRFRRMLRRGLKAPRTLLLVENPQDRRWIEAKRPLPDTSVLQMPGAGVDPDAFAPLPEPPAPIVVGVASRLVRSKGVDLVVDAVQRVRERGMPIELRIAGSIDHDNPEHVEEAELTRWGALPGVALVGRIADMNAFWALAHIACLPSRGGEGLPRLLLEAAACGRPIVTSDVPGCADFVVHGETGLVTPRGDVEALANALESLANDALARARLGSAGRARVVGGYTEQHAADCAARAWAAVSR